MKLRRSLHHSDHLELTLLDVLKLLMGKVLHGSGLYVSMMGLENPRNHLKK